ncbi:MAG: hypothetical protein QW241_04330, partial [Candidatus Bathyarchaeia archaeon]
MPKSYILHAHKIIGNFMPTIEVFRMICREVLHSSLGESAGEAVLFFLRRGLGRDPFEVFWEDPGAFYRELERVFGVG